MKSFISWLKRKARQWCAPGYDDLAEQLEDANLSLRSRETVSEQVARSNTMLRDALLATQKEKRALEQRAAHLDQRVKDLTFLPVTADDAPKWEGPDSERWRHFLSSTETGQKIQALANWHEQNANRAAVLRTQGADNNTGFARGWHNATAYFFQTLSATVPPQTDQEDKQPRDGASELLERVAP